MTVLQGRGHAQQLIRQAQPVYYLLASVIGEFAGAIPYPGGYPARLAARMAV